MTALCQFCNYCYATGNRDGKNTCDRCAGDFDIKSEPTRICPIDQSEMVKVQVESIVLDKCEKCDGVWLDGGEIELLRNVSQRNGYNKGQWHGLFWGALIG